MLNHPTAHHFSEYVSARFETHAKTIRRQAGDYILNPSFEDVLGGREFRDAAVLVPVIDTEDGLRVLLTQRTEHLSSHSGQVAFPGGKIDSGESAIEAALREAEEEVGLEQSSVEVLGDFGHYYSGSGYRITPVLGLVREDVALTPNENEVADLFKTPLNFLMDRENHQKESRMFRGKERFFYVIPWVDDQLAVGVERKIWGVTAGIIRVIQERLYG